MSGLIKVARTDQLSAGARKLCTVGERRIAKLPRLKVFGVAVTDFEAEARNRSTPMSFNLLVTTEKQLHRKRTSAPFRSRG